MPRTTNCEQASARPAPDRAPADQHHPVLVDLGYRGADSGYHHAINKPNLDEATKAANRFLTVLRCICERGNALLKAGWRYLRRVTCCPTRITQIARAALALTRLAYGW